MWPWWLGAIARFAEQGNQMRSQALRRASDAERVPAARKLSQVVQPTTNERTFDRNEIIVSKTDLQGRMTYVNRVFMTISDYTEPELLGLRQAGVVNQHLKMAFGGETLTQLPQADRVDRDA